MRHILFALFCYVLSMPALAHGIQKPRHGGIVDVGGEVTFELVRAGEKVIVYVDDHGKPVKTEGAVAEVLLASETGKRIALLNPNGGNALAGVATLPSRSTVFVRLTRSNGSVDVGEIRIP